jgi:DNA-binding NarL/FixJ family response regulator
MSATILIVEDHPTARQALQEWLQTEYPEHLVLAVSSGEEAIEMVRSLDLDVIIMDIDLPEMSGIEATRRIKAERLPQVVMLTIHEDAEHRNDALSAGASAFVPKRMMQSELLPALAMLLPPASATR